MFNKKNMMINCDLCDTRKMKEEDYADYEKIVINSDIVLINERSKSVLNRLPVMLNHDDMIEVPEDVEVNVKSINGTGKITGTTQVSDNTLLMVNGSLEIEPGTEEQLGKYMKIIVNGSVRYPESLGAYMGKASVNGSAYTYPDDYIILSDSFKMDKYFPLRARQDGRYYVRKRIVVTDKDIDLKKLEEKNVRLRTQEFVINEGKAEEAASLVNEEAQFVIIPDEMELLYDDVKLDEELLRKKGGKLFIYGDMTIEKGTDLAALMNKVQKIIVKGTVYLREEHKELLSQMDIEYEELVVEKDTRKFVNKPGARIDKLLFENSPEGIEVKNVAKVELAEDITPEMILDKLSIENCAQVICNEEQESAVSAIAVNVTSIGKSENNTMPGGLFHLGKELLNTKIVNADTYIM